MVDFATTTIIFNLGLLAGLSPCLFPVLPTYITFLANNKSSIINGLITSILVLLGIMTVFTVLGLITNLISDQILRFFGDNFREFQMLQGLLLVVLGALLIANFTFNFDRIYGFSGISQEKIQSINNPYTSSYLIGVFFAVIAAPCAMIYFLTLFSIVVGESILNIFLLMIVFSIGAGIPFFIIGFILPLVQELLDNRSEISSSQVSTLSHKINLILPRVTGALILFVGLFLIYESKIIQRNILN